MKEIKVLKFEVGKKCYESVIEDSVEAIQEFVEGYFETIPIDNTHILICNEEGKIRDLARSILLVGINSLQIKDVIRGNCFITKSRGANFTSLTKQDLKELSKRISFEEMSGMSILLM